MSGVPSLVDSAAVSGSKKRKTTPFTEQSVDPEVDNTRIQSVKAVIYPQLLMEEIPMTENGKRVTLWGRQAASDCLHGKDDRLVVVVGPCSIHDPNAAMDYAKRLRVEAERLSSDLVILMRVYFEKPRTTVGWKGLINDPHMDGTFDINQGLKTARRLLADISDLGLPCACEFLETITPQYIADLVAWAAIGARTTESQLHRQLASGLSMPVGFKNGTSGDLQIAIDAIRSSEADHCFLSITKQGLPAIVVTEGNPDTHVVLRGGNQGTNYDSKSVQAAVDKLKGAKVNEKTMVDCSHGNSNKDHRNQPKVAADIAEQIRGGSEQIFGVMVESHIMEGKQNLPPADKSPSPANGGGGETMGVKNHVLSQLRYGVSITDACIGWMDTVAVLDMLAGAVRDRRALKK